MRHSDSLAALGKALAAAQAELAAAVKDKQNPHLGTAYADLGATWEACRGALTRHGLAVAQGPGADARGEPVLETILLHESGEWLASDVPLVYSANERGRSVMQALGSAISYARRYGLAALVGVYAEDDDGQGAGAAAPPDRRAGHRPGQAPPRPEGGPDRGPAPPAGAPERLYSKWAEHAARVLGITAWQLNNHLYKWACATEIAGECLVPEPIPNATNGDKFAALERVFKTHRDALRAEVQRYRRSEAVRLANSRRARREPEAAAPGRREREPGEEG